MNKWARAASMGAVTGIRSAAGLRIAADSYSLGRFRPWVSRMLWAEAAMDKMPFMPARTQAVSLVGRGLLGGLAGASIDGRESERAKDRLLLGAVGAASAVAATFAACRLRQSLGRRSRIAGAAMGVAEDVVVAAVTRRVETA